MQHIDSVWRSLIRDILTEGNEVRPRGKLTRELLAKTTVVDMGDPVLTLPERKLGYKFLAAEAHWILSGDNRVSTIAPYSQQIAQFSDDGERFFGAYGPRVIDQLGYVTSALASDLESRQAVMTIWRERPGPTKDVPCTVSLQFMVRNGRLNCHATMRSSDAWLGWVYDVFNFSMVSWTVLQSLQRKLGAIRDDTDVSIGSLYLTAASQHLYAHHFEACEDIVIKPSCKEPRLRRLDQFIDEDEAFDILAMLGDMRTRGVDTVLAL